MPTPDGGGAPAESCAPDTVTFRLAEILGPPPIIPGERAEEYAALLEAIRAELRPRGIIEEILVERITAHVWETRRLRHLRDKLLTDGAVAGVRRLLDRVEDSSSSRDRSLLQYALGNAEVRTAVKDRLTQAGFDESSIAAETMIARLPDIERLERLRTQGEARAIALLREIERRRFSFASRAKDVLLEAASDAASPSEAGVP
jgi:hypothetical protein